MLHFSYIPCRKLHLNAYMTGRWTLLKPTETETGTGTGKLPDYTEINTSTMTPILSFYGHVGVKRTTIERGLKAYSLH